MKALYGIILLIIVALAEPVSADYIFRADGAVIEAKIISQTATSVTIVNNKGRRETIKGNDILRIRQKPFIKKNARILDFDRGRIFYAFIVDETPSELILRLELGSPDEIRVRREKILTLKESIESTPEAIPGARDITLQWDAVPGAEKYMICSAEAGGRYSLISESVKPFEVIKNLKGNTPYNLVVFASDGKGDGWEPTKPVKCMTLNNPPESPKPKLSFLAGDIVLSWEKTRDEDGTVKAYIVSEKINGVFTEIARTEFENFSLKGDDSVIRVFAVTAVDDKKAESPKSFPVKTRELKTYYYKTEIVYAYPFGGLSDDFKYGRGLFLSGERKNIFLPDLSLGLNLGALQFIGDGYVEGDLFAVCAETRCSYEPSPKTLVFGSFSAGPAYYGGRGKTRDFSRRGASFILKSGMEHRIGVIALSGNVLWGNFYSRNLYRYFFGASVAAGTAVDF
jgi:hypothetical protein